MLRRVLTLGACLLLAAGAACSSFSASSVPGDDAGIDAAANDSAAEAGVDAATLLCDGFDAGDPDADAGTTASCDGMGATPLLTDPMNCGRCGHACGASSSCNVGECSPFAIVAAEQDDIVYLQGTDSTSLYWTNIEGEIHRAALETGANNEILGVPSETADAYHQVEQVAASDRVYVREYSYLGYAPGDAGAVQDLGPIGGYGWLALLESGVIVTEASSNTVAFFASDGGTLLSYTGQARAHDLAVTPDLQRAFWLDRADPDAGVDAPSELMGWTAGHIYDLGPVVADPRMGFSNVLAADNDYLYIVGSGGSILRRPADSSTTTPTMIVPPDGALVQSIVTDGDRVFWMSTSDLQNMYDYDISSVSRCGGPVTIVVTASSATFLASGLALDAKYVYFGGNGQIWRVVK